MRAVVLLLLVALASLASVQADVPRSSMSNLLKKFPARVADVQPIEAKFAIRNLRADVFAIGHPERESVIAALTIDIAAAVEAFVKDVLIDADNVKAIGGTTVEDEGVEVPVIIRSSTVDVAAAKATFKTEFPMNKVATLDSSVRYTNGPIFVDVYDSSVESTADTDDSAHLTAGSMLFPNGLTSAPSISSHYGWRIHPISGERKLHAGTDYVGFSAVKSISSGTVIAVGVLPGWSAGGNQVYIDHGNGVRSRSLHLSSWSVRSGQQVSVGQTIGVQGATGAVTGVHLHLEISVNGNGVDPHPFLSARVGPGGGGGGLVVDGIVGPATIRAEQRALGVAADGIIGPNTIRARQRKVGTAADGLDGPNTRRAWQRYLGVTADGIVGPNTIRALQRRLNAGTY